MSAGECGGSLRELRKFVRRAARVKSRLVVVGALLVVLGFALAVAWDVIRDGLARARRDAAVLATGWAEIDAARSTAANNQQLARDDAGFVEKKSDDVVNSLDPIEGGQRSSRVISLRRKVERGRIAWSPMTG
jgi:hypothetical protein